MAYIRALSIPPHVAGINEILAYSRLPKQKVMQQMKETKRMEFSLSAIIPNIGEKIICPRASAATIKPYSSKLTRPSSYELGGSCCIMIGQHMMTSCVIIDIIGSEIINSIKSLMLQDVSIAAFSSNNQFHGKPFFVEQSITQTEEA